MRILGIDYGTKRIGIAVTDPLGLGAQPLKVIENNADVTDNILCLVREYSIGKIVVGLPKTLSGTIGLSAEKVLEFVGRIKKIVNVPVETFDERLTTSEAQRTLIEHGMKRSKRKEAVDKLAATYILQGYLSKKGNK